MKKDKSAYNIKAIESALDLLEQFIGNGVELGTTELSRRLGLSKNNVFRLLATLASRNYLEQNSSTHNYRLGLKNVELGQAVIRQLELHRQARPVLEKLVHSCNETSELAILRGADVFYLDVVESAQSVRVLSRAGCTFPAYGTAAGKVLLASGSGPSLMRNLLAGDSMQYAPNTAMTWHQLMDQLEKTAAQGYALEDEKMKTDVRGIAAPVCNHAGSIVGAVSIFGPAFRFSMTRIHNELLPLVKVAAKEISDRLGYCEPHVLAKTA